MKTFYSSILILFFGYFANAQDPNAFIMTFEVELPNLNIAIPLSYASSNSYTINFGDSSSLTNQTGSSYHTYSAPGNYTVTVSGIFKRIDFGSSIYPEKLKTIEQWGSTQWINMEEAFKGCINLTINAIDTPDLTSVTNMRHMFREASSLNQNLNNWNVSNVIDMEGLFYQASSFNQPLNNWDVSNVVNMKNIFMAAASFNQPLNNWNVSSVTNMQGMFSSSAFNQPINTWDTSSVTNIQEIFRNIESFNQPLNNWDVSNVTNMQEAFSNAYAFNQPLDSWDVSSVTNMQEMFYTSNFNQPINNWNVSNVTNMQGMFNASVFNQPLTEWDVSGVTNMKEMFAETQVFAQNLNDWDVSSVTTMQGMFRNSSFNQPLNNWDVSNVTSMTDMFSVAIEFNQPLNDWDVSLVTIMQGMFRSAQVFNQPLDNWDVSAVTNMYDMFNGAIYFNQPLNSWNVSAVINMEKMLSGTAYNYPVSNWNVANVTNMRGLFGGIQEFNQDLSSWNFNANVSLGNNSWLESGYFVGLSGIDIQNYDALLLRFAELGLENKTMRSNQLHYCNAGVRNYLVTNLGWTITGDSVGAECIGNTLTGTIHFDENANGCDENDVAISSLLVSGNNDSAFTYATTPDETGQYNLLFQDDSYDISLLNLPSYFTATPATSTVSFTGFGNTQSLDFCLTANEAVQDLNITLLPIGDARPGFEAAYQLVASNIGTQTINNAMVSLSYDVVAQSFVSASQTADTATAGQLGFTIATLQPFETSVIDVVMQTITPPTVNGGDILNFTATVTPDTGDYTPDDNTFDFAQIVVNSFDPNDKRVVQGDEITIDQAGGYLDYIIRFQNTGTASAIKVRIADELSDKLDWATLTPISASHNYTVRITDGNQVEFIFDNINLPAQQDDDAGSNGYIAYKIKPVQNVAIGDIIDGNAASIYFDYNLPIITNAVATEMVSPTSGTNGFTLSSLISLYPNPTNDILNIKKNGNILLQGATIFNLQGRELLSFGQDTETINLKSLQSGIYLIAIKTNKGILNQRLIKN